MAARVRLHVGALAPCTVYIGRPVFESGVLADEAGRFLAAAFDRDLHKSAHLTANACTSMFMNGIAGCKVSMEHMRASQIVTFMTVVAGSASRDHPRQQLSAAFNVNTPILDDRNEPSEWVSGPSRLAALGIDLTVAGGFDEVAWDGASSNIPSEPVIERLPPDELLLLTHKAHEARLRVYISAGLRPQHVREIVYCGVDGIGIGTGVHHVNACNGRVGRIDPDAIISALTTRDDAATHPLGVGARLLARLDAMRHRRSLPARLDEDRQLLADLLRDRRVDAVQTIVNRLDSGNRPG